ncbi:dethiobiotin synthase [Thalassotalea euphylliae]|uniref:ATP-dependent dethiobiotin synthetase BioD n=1 Tax=Thalassotalea euphylliae TaxID=1655234 RepID=A0A3E0TYN4_9GAMM|nr:dethiobiotin synthase [Thalassotalea euphylliae]REL29574.1 dethiobiotin synthase [Thalassotalea euphylliae]
MPRKKTKHLFVTATDTDAGKTLVACAIVNILTKARKVAVFKPISAGCDNVSGQLVNHDALQLQQLANCNQPLESVNPVAFEEPIAPHIAAQTLGQKINAVQVTDLFKSLDSFAPDVILTEGAGGWRLPLGGGQFLSDFAKQTEQHVILVVNMKLGCLNHALLSYEAIKRDGLTVVGWVANCIVPMDYQQENITELSQYLDAPLLGVVPNVENAEQASKFLDKDLIEQIASSHEE